MADESIKAHLKVIDAMTEEERANPELLFQRSFQAKQRISQISGQPIANINKLVSLLFLLQHHMLSRLFLELK
jgi:signal recognition particle GTPase